MTSLSILCVTKDPGPQVIAALEPLRGIADEIVIAADAVVDDATLAEYHVVSDRLVLFDFAPPIERVLSWAHAQCRGDWILRLDGDEVVSPALIEQLPLLIGRDDRQQYWFQRRWVYPDNVSWIADRAWSPDFQLRLVRNDPKVLSFPGTVHTSALPVDPMEFRAEPLYHLDLLLQSPGDRARKAATYEALLPGLRLPGGAPAEMMYVPEEWPVRQLLPIPEHDRASVMRVLEAGWAVPRAELPPVDRASLTRGTREAIDARWDALPMAPSDYACSIRVLDVDLRLAPGRADAITVEVGNRGGATWPGGLDRHPLVRLGYRWLSAEGALVEANTGRTALRSPVRPGETVIAQLGVVPPEEPGNYLVEVDLLQENERWFGNPLRIPVEVVDPAEPTTSAASTGSRTGIEGAHAAL